MTRARRKPVLDAQGQNSKDRALARLFEYRAKKNGSRPEDIPEVDDFPATKIPGEILSAYRDSRD